MLTPGLAHAQVSRELAEVFEKTFEALCERIAMAGYKMIRTFKAVDNDDSPLSFETRDKKDARKGAIINIHPSYQCRIDTFLAGASGASRPKCWYNP